MARVTVEDCMEIVPSRFELVVLAAQRAKEIASGAKVLIDKDDDKGPVIALREIASKKIDHATLKDSVIRKYMNLPQIEESEDLPEEEDLLEMQKDMANAFQPSDSQGMSFEDEETEAE